MGTSLLALAKSVYYKVQTAGLILNNTDRQCVSTSDVR